jgi:hypothetical protein
VWPALAAGVVPRRPGDPSATVEQFARWTAVRQLAIVCRDYAERDDWAKTMIVSLAQDGDWVHGLVSRSSRDKVVAALTTAAGQLREHRAAAY